MATRKNASQLHRTTLSSLREIFPGTKILEEYKIRSPRTGKYLWLDMYLPTFSLAVEVQGSQHTQFSPFYHDSKTAFTMQQSRDGDKVAWCVENGVNLICIYEGEEITSSLIKQRWKEAIDGQEA